MKRIAIIGASTGQLPLCKKAHEMGLESYCFAWPKDAICKEYVDHFIPISIFEMDEIVRYCQEINVDGVVSNASETTALVVAYVAEKLGKQATSYQAILNIQNKEFVRQKTNWIEGLGHVRFTVGKLNDIIPTFPYPYVLKPLKGASKKGVNFVSGIKSCITVPDDLKDGLFMAEEYISGQEYSIESISFNDRHDIIQITEKVTTGAPHFVELEHHQPAHLSPSIEKKIRNIIPPILSSVNFSNGASHIEIKVNDQGDVYLIEVNPRGGGDYISNDLVSLSTDYDYLKQMILVALGEYNPVAVHHVAYAGIYFLSAYTKRLLPYFNIPLANWMVRRERKTGELTVSSSNYDRDGFIIYCSDKKIVL